jgi:large conductance mechanosensitive channel
MWKEFKAFMARGNVLDLAVAVVIGAAFGKIVSSFVDELLNPVLGLLLGKVDLANLYVSLNGQAYPSLAAAKEAGAPVLAYGLFLNNVVNFVIVAFAIFLMVRAANRFKAPEAAAPATTRDCPYCLMPVPLAATRCGHCTSTLPA